MLLSTYPPQFQPVDNFFESLIAKLEWVGNENAISLECSKR